MDVIVAAVQNSMNTVMSWNSRCIKHRLDRCDPCNTMNAGVGVVGRHAYGQGYHQDGWRGSHATLQPIPATPAILTRSNHHRSTTIPHTERRAGYKWPEATVTWQDLCVTRTAVPADESVPNLLQPLTQLFRRQQPSSITALQPTSGVLRPGVWGCGI
jgi:hypothetical protein